MKAAVFREYNKDPTKVVKIEDIDMPKLKPNEIMIKVEASSIQLQRSMGYLGRSDQNTAPTYFWK